MPATELLRLIIDADGKGAIRGLEQVGGAADRNLGKATKNLDRIGAQMTSFGTATVAAAAVAGAGLFKVAESASDYGEAVSAAGVIFEDAVGSIEKFGEAAADTAGLSKTAAVDAANQFGTLAKAAGLTGDSAAQFSTQLAQLAGDLASFKNTSPEEAIAALGSGLRGEAEPLRRYGILLDDLTLKAEAAELGIYDGNGALTQQQKILAANSAIFQQSSDAQGDFVRTSDSLANQQRILAAEFENVKIAIGEGLLPFAQSAVGAVGGITEAFNSLSDGNQRAIGTFAGWATVGTGVVGALSLIGGQAIKLRERFTTLTVAGDQSFRSLNNLGRVAIGTAAIGGIAAISTALYDLTNVSRDATEQITALQNRLSEGNPEAAFDRLIERTRELDGGFEDFVEGVGDLGRNLRFVEIGQYTVDLYDFRTALEEVGAESPRAALQMIAFAESLGISGGNADKLIPALDELRSKFQEEARANERAGAAAAEAGGPTADYSDILAGLEYDAGGATGAIGELTNSLEGVVEPLLGLGDAQQGYTDALSDIEKAQRDVDEARSNMNASAEEEADRLRDIEDAARDVDDAYRSLFDAQRNLLKERRDLARIDEDLAEANAELAGITPGTVEYDQQAEDVKSLTRRREDAVFSLESALLREQDAQRSIQDSLRDQADTYKEINEEKSKGSDAARDLADAEKALSDAEREAIGAKAALDQEVIDLYESFREQGLSVEDALTAMQAWAADAPPVVQSAVQEMLGDLFPLLVVLKQLQSTAAEGIPDPREGIPWLDPSRRTQLTDGLDGGLFSAAAKKDQAARDYINAQVFGRAMGGPVSANTPYMVGERGPELFMPNTNGQIIPNDKLGKGGNTYNIYAPPEATKRPEDVVRAMKSAEFLFEGVR